MSAIQKIDKLYPLVDPVLPKASFFEEEKFPDMDFFQNSCFELNQLKTIVSFIMLLLSIFSTLSTKMAQFNVNQQQPQG